MPVDCPCIISTLGRVTRVAVVLPALVELVALLAVRREREPQVGDGVRGRGVVPELSGAVVVLRVGRRLAQAEVDVAELEGAPRAQHDGVEDRLGAAVEAVLVGLGAVAGLDGAGDLRGDFAAGGVAPVCRPCRRCRRGRGR